MKKRILSYILVTVVIVICIIPVGAVSITPYATGKFTLDAEAGEFIRSNNTLALEKGEEVTISGVFTPDSAVLDVGIYNPSTNTFYSQRSTDGTINVTISVLRRGNYYLAVRNNSDDIVSITGYVTY